MTTVPQISIILPVRCRTTFTTNALASLIEHGIRKDHQIILVLDKTSLTYEMQRYPNKFPKDILQQDEEGMKRVDNWVDTHSDILKKYDIKIVIAKGGEDLWLDHKRVSFALEEGRKHVKYNWILGYADEDLVFQKYWDYNLWRYMSDKDPKKYCVVPTKVSAIFVEQEPEISFAWLSNRVNSFSKTWMIIPFPVSDRKILEWKYRLPYKNFHEYMDKILLYGNAFFENCGLRINGDSSPFFVHKSLVDSVNGWSIDGWFSDCHSLDARFDFRLGSIGIIKIIPRDCFVLHTKNPLFISEEVDRIWADISYSPISGSVTHGLL